MEKKELAVLIVLVVSIILVIGGIYGAVVYRTKESGKKNPYETPEVTTVTTNTPTPTPIKTEDITPTATPTVSNTVDPTETPDVTAEPTVVDATPSLTPTAIPTPTITGTGTGNDSDLESFNKGSLTMKVKGLGPDGELPVKNTCDGENFSPVIELHGVPEGARRAAVLMEDPNSESGEWINWVAWDIPVKPDVRNTIWENIGNHSGVTIGTSSWGVNSYGGPCPLKGEHLYLIKVYILDDLLRLPNSASKEELLRAMEGHLLDKALVIGKYERPETYSGI